MALDLRKDDGSTKYIQDENATGYQEQKMKLKAKKIVSKSRL